LRIYPAHRVELTIDKGEVSESGGSQAVTLLVVQVAEDGVRTLEVPRRRLKAGKLLADDSKHVVGVVEYKGPETPRIFHIPNVRFGGEGGTSSLRDVPSERGLQRFRLTLVQVRVLVKPALYGATLLKLDQCAAGIFGV